MEMEQRDGVVYLRGRFDAAQTAQAETFFAELEESQVIDLSELQYIASAGLGVLFATQKRLTEQGHAMSLRNLNPHLLELFTLAGFDKVFEIETNSEDPGAR